MRGFSKAIVAGNVTRDPEMRTTPNGAQNCNFTIAVNRAYRDANGNNQEATSFIDCVAWSRTAETICQYIHKGDPFLVSGRLDQHSWEDKQSGQRRSRTEITVEDFTFLPRGGGDGGSYGNSNYNNGYSNSGSFANSGSSYSAPASTSAPAPDNSAPKTENGDVIPSDADVPENGEVDLSDIPF